MRKTDRAQRTEHEQRRHPSEPLPDEALIAKAGAGDQDAFGELVRRHRARTLGFAQAITRDAYLAEDIVQEALLRAFAHLGELNDAERFVPWLNRIVHNLAMMKLRRGGPYRYERPESFFRPLANVPHGDASAQAAVDFGGWIDRLQASRPAGSPHDPEGALLQKQYWNSIRTLLSGLGVREREIFEAHVFRQLTPGQIAELFAISQEHVYNTISASRKKLTEQRIRIFYSEYIRERRVMGRKPAMTLHLHRKRGASPWKQCPISAAVCVHEALRFTNAGRWSLVDVMGLTGLAFRLNVERERIDLSGPSSYYWETMFTEGLRQLGAGCRFIGDGGLAPSPFALNEAIRHIEMTIAQGVPAIAWDLFAPEFGLIYGYDAERQLLFAEDPKAGKPMSYMDLGRGRMGGLFVLIIEDTFPADPAASLRGALGLIVGHARGERCPAGYAGGLEAYDVWIDASRKGTVDPLGSRYTAVTVAAARAYAVRFLREWGRKTAGAAGQLLAEAADCWHDAANALQRLRQMDDEHAAGEYDAARFADNAVEALSVAKEAEEAGIGLLELALRSLKPMEAD